MYCKIPMQSACCRSSVTPLHSATAYCGDVSRTRIAAQPLQSCARQPDTNQVANGSWPEEERTRFMPELVKLPNQADSLSRGQESGQEIQLVADRSVSDLDCFTELLALQKNGGAKKIGFFGTRNMGFMHQQLIEVLSFALIHTGHEIVTSGSTGTNAAVIKGALKDPAGADKLRVIIPQSLHKQPEESQELLQQVKNLMELKDNDHLSLLEASRICNKKIIEETQQIICFAFHDSRLLLETCAEAKDKKKIVTLFFLD